MKAAYSYPSQRRNFVASQASSDVAATKSAANLTTIMHAAYDELPEDFIRNSFYLPVQVLKAAEYKVEDINVISGTEFQQLLEIPGAKDKIKAEGATMQMLASAKHVGVSVRTILATGEWVCICKLWYGRTA